MTQEKKFKVYWDEVYCFEALVEATSLQEAIRFVKSDSTLYCHVTQAQYVESSIDINHDLCESENDDNGFKGDQSTYVNPMSLAANPDPTRLIILCELLKLNALEATWDDCYAKIKTLKQFASSQFNIEDYAKRQQI